MITLMILGIFPNVSISQTFQLLGDKCFGGTSFDQYGNIILNGNEIIISSWSASGIGGIKSIPLCNPGLLTATEYDYWLLSIDTAFNINWQSGLGGNHTDVYTNITLGNSNTFYLFSGVSRSDSSCDKSENNRSYPIFEEDYWVGAINSNGTKIWDRTLGGSALETYSKIVQLSTGDIIVAGSSSSPADGDKTVSNFGMYDWWIVKLDSAGNKIWDKVYGNSNQEQTTANNLDLLALDNGNYLFAGKTNSESGGTITDSSRGGQDFWISMIDSSGTQIWDKRYGGSSGEFLFDVAETKDGGYIMCGASNSPISGEVSDTSRGGYDYWIVKVDSSGNKVWDKRYGGSNLDEAKSIQETADGGYLVGGNTRSGMGLDLSEPQYGFSDYWILKLDSLGNKVWDKRFGGYGGNSDFSGFVILPDSSILLFGSSDSTLSPVKTDPGYGSGDLWLIRFAYNDSTVGVNEVNTNNFEFSLYPNPATNELIIYSNSNLAIQNFSLYDLTGRLMYEQFGLDKMTVNISHLEPAIYFYQILDSRNQLYNGKFLKQR